MTDPVLKLFSERRKELAARAQNDPDAAGYEGGQTPQSEGAAWFQVLDLGTGVIELSYDADLGRGFGHDHIKERQDEGEKCSQWVVRPAYSRSQLEDAYQRGLKGLPLNKE